MENKYGYTQEEFDVAIEKLIEKYDVRQRIKYMNGKSNDPESIAFRNRIMSAVEEHGVGALYETGVGYYEGKGISINKRMAVSYFVMAAELGYINAAMTPASAGGG